MKAVWTFLQLVVLGVSALFPARLVEAGTPQRSSVTLSGLTGICLCSSPAIAPTTVSSSSMSPDECPNCEGSGSITKTCPKCGGSGIEEYTSVRGQRGAYGCTRCGGRRGNLDGTGYPGSGEVEETCPRCKGTGEVSGRVVPPRATGYWLVTIYNPTPGIIYISIRTASGGKWFDYSVDAGSSRYFYAEEPVSFGIYFDSSYKPGLQGREYDLPHATLPTQPTSGGGREYAFETQGDTIDLKTFSGDFSALVDWERQKADDRQFAKLQEELRKQEEARRREEERLRPMREAVARGRKAYDEGKYELAIREFKSAMKTVPYDPEIPDLIKQADQQLRREKGCNETHAKALAYFNQKDWGNALRYWKEAKAYCKDPSVIDGWMILAQAEQDKDSQMLALNAAANELFGKEDYVGAYYKYKEALAKRDNAIVKANLQNAQNQCNDRMHKSNNKGNSLLEQEKYFDAFVAYWTALKNALDFETSRKVIKDNLKRAVKGLTPEELARLEELGPEGVEQMYAVLPSSAPPAATSANGNPAPPRDPLANKDIDRIRQKFQQKYPGADGIDWDSIRKDKE